MKNDYPQFDERKKEFLDDAEKKRNHMIRNRIAIIVFGLIILIPIIVEVIRGIK